MKKNVVNDFIESAQKVSEKNLKIMTRQFTSHLFIKTKTEYIYLNFLNGFLFLIYICTAQGDFF